ncbi:ABC transporter ATP-binding protein [Bacteriovorax sp. Seq25_V]|uniref:ABC transporter ATP-binding protein n=1 Tax=Bacteriovorax sp. Seq25_V TaxID=1201288 RepID=UPI00038A2199|nr:ABC transporter ATP-binding protein [Bacteriovorax sp. Seq25_V]EQC43722.1 ABC transporter, ATP-binding protein [Bacteriovorax sp. Seq25_V]
MLEIRNINKGFQNDTYTPILQGASLHIGSGQKVAILGKSGSGKSTLLTLISGIALPESGNILIDGEDITTLGEDARAKFRSHHISIIFQDYKLIDHLNALENVALPLRLNNISDYEAQAKLMLDKVGLGERVHSFPETLSGGERQRVAIARALALNSKVILADEPNANLDIETGHEVMGLLFDLVKEFDRTLILVTHDRDLALKCDTTYSLSKGLLEKMP